MVLQVLFFIFFGLLFTGATLICGKLTFDMFVDTEGFFDWVMAVMMALITIAVAGMDVAFWCMA